MRGEQPRGARSGALRRRVLALVTLTVLGALWAAPRAAADGPDFTAHPHGVDTITGIAADPATQTYWVSGANGTGSRGSVHGLSASGAEKGAIEFRADVQSVQALAYRSGRLYVGDIGDPQQLRDHVTVYYFDNVTPADGVITYHAWDFRYPDGAKNAQAMVVDDTGRLYLITTGGDAGVYAAPAQPSRQGVNALTRVGDAPSGDITDAVALGSGRWAVRTKDSVQVIDADSYQVTAGGPLPVSGGEALGTPLGGGTDLLAVGPGSSASVYALAAPTTIASPTPTASPASSASAGDAQPAGGQEHTGAGNRTGTWVAIGLAAALAVLAGLAVVLLNGRGGARDDATPDPDGTWAPAPLPPVDPAPLDLTAPLPPLPPAGLPAELATAPATPVRAEPVATRAAGRTGIDDTVRPPRRAREPGDIEDDDDEGLPLDEDDDLDRPVLRGRLPTHAAGEETVDRPPLSGQDDRS